MNIRFTSEMDDKIREMASPDTSWRVIAEALDLPVKSVSSRGSRLGVQSGFCKRRPANPNATPEQKRKRITSRLKTRGLQMGAIAPHLDDEKVDWLAANMPGDMTVAEYLIAALLSDAIAEGADG